MFRGINAIQLDEKGRLVLPSRQREILRSSAEQQLVMTIDTESTCLLLYPLSEWEEIEYKIEALPSFDLAARRIQRLLLGHATDVTIDGQGRILVPPLLREHARLEKQVMLIGQGKKFELWDEQTWRSQRSEWLIGAVQDLEQLPTELRSLSL